jgi:addiction module HigA family antidote
MMSKDLEFAPPHPGAYLREDVLPAIGMTVTDLATHLGVTRVTMSTLIHERRDLSMEMAQRLGQALGNGPRFWLALQMQHDLWNATRKSDINVKPIATKA